MKVTKQLLTVLMAVIVALGGFTVILSSINPGFEGAKCWFYGMDFIGSDWSDWSGSGFHAYHEGEDPLMTLNRVADMTDTVYWSSFNTPNDAGVGHRWWSSSGFGGWREKPHLKVQVESNIMLSDITRQGDPDPLDFNEAQPLDGRRIEYWSMKSTKMTETDEKVLYEYELTKESFLITPAEFWVGFYLVPSQDDAGTGSGWREGTWSDMTGWFMLDFHVWDNAYYDEWMNDPQDEVLTTEYGGTIISQEKKLDPDGYRGGFPIAGWIQGWERAGWTSAGGDSQSPVWYDLRGAETGSYTQEQLWDLHDILMAKTEFSPSMVGSFISLYDSPDRAFSYAEPSFTDFDNSDELVQEVKTPDTSMQKVMYFPINVESFGTYAVDQGWWGLMGWKVYYPSAYFRIRLIYGVYGSFKYLWTEEVTKPFLNETTGEYEGGLDYPDEFERHGTTIIHTTGPLSPFGDLAGGLSGWFGNPLNQIWTLFIILIVIIVFVTALNPGIWSQIAKLYGTSKKGRKGWKT